MHAQRRRGLEYNQRLILRANGGGGWGTKGKIRFTKKVEEIAEAAVCLIINNKSTFSNVFGLHEPKGPKHMVKSSYQNEEV
jgi:hypothetical protein